MVDPWEEANHDVERFATMFKTLRDAGMSEENAIGLVRERVEVAHARNVTMTGFTSIPVGGVHIIRENGHGVPAIPGLTSGSGIYSPVAGWPPKPIGSE